MISYLAQLDEHQLAKQIQYLLDEGLVPAIEYARQPDPHNHYWDMWKLPLFQARAVEDVLTEIQACAALHPDCFIKLIGYDMAKEAARQVYEQTGVGPEDVQVVELHDCFTANELLTYEALGLTADGTAEKFIWDGDNTYGGKYVTNPSGGLLSKGHPLGATGLAQCAELVWQLRGEADKRQVEGATHALQHNLGLGGACVVTLYGKA